MKNIKLRKIEEDDENFLEIIITEGNELFKYLTITSYDCLKIPSNICKINKCIFNVKDDEISIIKKAHEDAGLSEEDYDYFMEMIYQLQFEEVYIPKTVTEICEAAFVFAGIEKFKVDKENTSFVYKNGLLYDKRKKVLLACSGEVKEKLRIPKFIRRIGENAFSSIDCCDEITLDISEGVEEIGPDALDCAFDISSIYLPRSIKNIGQRAFGYGDGEYPKIYVYENSYAHKYVMENNIEYILRED